MENASFGASRIMLHLFGGNVRAAVNLNTQS